MKTRICAKKETPKPLSSEQMKTITDLKSLATEVRKLKRLLDDPQPGLFTWAQMYGDSMQAMSDFWNEDLLKAGKGVLEAVKSGYVCDKKTIKFYCGHVSPEQFSELHKAVYGAKAIDHFPRQE